MTEEKKKVEEPPRLVSMNGNRLGSLTPPMGIGLISFQISTMAGVWTSKLAVWWPRTLPLDYSAPLLLLWAFPKKPVKRKKWKFSFLSILLLKVKSSKFMEKNSLDYVYQADL